jgi:tRNA threonylcarbamoyladenosine biosynthesis protein TsaE
MGWWTVVSKSSRQTMDWGRRLGTLVEGGEIIGLVGELGAGKTAFARGFTEGVEVGKEVWVRSPTFTLINEYSGRLPVYHIDLYRVAKCEDLDGLNLREYLFGDGVSLIEWFDRLPASEVDDYLEIKIAHLGGAQRRLTFVAHGDRYERILDGLKAHKFRRSKGSRSSSAAP